MSPDSSTFPTVEYRYDLNGQHYAGSNPCFGPASEAAGKLVGLQAGQKVNVFVNPANPQEAVLLPGPSSFAQAGLTAGGVLVIVGLIVGGSALAYRASKQMG